LLALAASIPDLAGGIFSNSNQSAEYIRSFDRNSAIDNADIVFYNPAGTVNLRPGFSFNVSNQSILQRTTVRTLDNPVLGERTYRSDNPAWLMPNAYAVYRKDHWAVFTALETIGATAVRRWPDGLPSLDLAGKRAAGYAGGASSTIAGDAYAAALGAGATPAQAQAAAVAASLDASAFPSSSSLKGSSCFLGWRHGAAWRIGPRWALALAGRWVYARQDITGGAYGACSYDRFGHDLRTRTRALIDVSSTAMGYSLEIGVNLYPAEGLVLSLGYGMATGLGFRTSVRDGKDGNGRFRNGSLAHLDLPQTWQAGVGYQATPRLRASVGMNAYLEHSARMDLLNDPTAGIDSRRDYGNTYEVATALEYRLGPRWLVSLGTLFTWIGQAKSATLDTSLPGAHANYLSLGTGCQFQASARTRINFGLACTGFTHRYQAADLQGDRSLQAGFAAAGVAISPRKEYDKRYLILAVGLDCHLPR
jgi:long-subunit fatty acid transport protein